MAFSSSEARQDTVTAVDESYNVVGGSGIMVDAGQATRRATINVNADGLSGSDVQQLFEGIGLFVDRQTQTAADITRQVIGQTSDAMRAIGDIATSATGADTEAGRLIGRLALPVLLAVVAIAFFWSRKK